MSQWIALLLFACGTSPPEAPNPPSPALPAAEPHEHEHPDDAPAPEAHAEHEEHPAVAPTAIPGSLPEAIGALNAQRDRVETLIGAGKLSDIHPITEQMGKLVVLLPIRAKELPSADKTTVTVAATDLKKSLDALHHAADGGNAEETRAELTRLDEQLAKLKPYE